MAEKPEMAHIESAMGTKTKEQILGHVWNLATQFSVCVEAFNLIYPSKDSDRPQKVALAKLGLQQGRLLIFGDCVGISAPPATIATHMIPRHPGITNPDPHLPVHFGVRDPRLDDDAIHAKIAKALHEIAGRPSNVSREELMSVYGMKQPKTFAKNGHPALDTNRLEGFREKYNLLNDLVKASGAHHPNLKRNSSMANSHWTIKDAAKFNAFVNTVREEVDTLVTLMGVTEQVDRGIRSDIRCMAWHPDLSGPVVRQDWEKLKLIKEASAADYPEYVEVADMALQYINEELKEKNMADRYANYGMTLNPPIDGAAGGRRKSDYDVRSVPPAMIKAHERKASQDAAKETSLQADCAADRRSSWMSSFKLNPFKASKHEKHRSKSHSEPGKIPDPIRSMSESEAIAPDQWASEQGNHSLEPIRSKSLSAVPDALTLDLDSRVRGLSVVSDTPSSPLSPPAVYREGRIIKDFAPINYERTSIDQNTLIQTDTASSGEYAPDSPGLYNATTASSLVDRHDQYSGVGRIATQDIRQMAHDTDKMG